LYFLHFQEIIFPVGYHLKASSKYNPFPRTRKFNSMIMGFRRSNLPIDAIKDKADPRDQEVYRFGMTPFRKAVTLTLEGVFHFIMVMKVQGEEKLPAEGPVIVAANHLTNFDVFPLQFALPRPLFYMGKEELFRNPVMDRALRELGAFPVYRGAQDVWAIRHSQRVLEHGQVLGIFPEGTRNKGSGLRPAKTGAARLALEARCPIVPVAIQGTQDMFKHFPHRSRVTITVGEPIQPQPGEMHIDLTERMMFALAEMLPQEARGVYRYRPPGF
jgi:1-acyl-sn-glycerol-3-phosphate acyltransferase